MIPPHHRAFIKALAKLTVRSLLKKTPDELRKFKEELESRDRLMADNNSNCVGNGKNILITK